METELKAPPEIDDARKEIETHLAADETIPPGLLRRYAALWHTTFQLDHHILSFAWPPAVHGTASIRGWAFLVIWQRSPVDGSWELKPPFASIELISAVGDQSGGGQQTGIGVVPRRSFDFDSGPFSTPVLLEAGREYVVGVEVKVRVDVNIVDGSNRPYNIDRGAGDVWFCWGDIIAAVPQIQIDVTNVLVP